MKYILICNCSGSDKKAVNSYEILFPDTPIPEIIKGSSLVAEFASEYSNEHLKAISRSKRFAYYVEINEDGKIIEEYNLDNGRRII